MYALVCTSLTYLMQLYSKLVHVKFRKATLGISEVGATISVRDCETRLGVSEIENGEA